MNVRTVVWCGPLWPILALAGASVWALGGCAATSEDHAAVINALVQDRKYEEAVVEAKKRSDARPDDPAARDVWRLASVAYLLEQGRRLTFEDRDLEALAKFTEASQLAPETVEPIHWRDATLRKLTDQWMERAWEFHNSDNLVEASNCYEKALEYTPDDLRAKQGLGRVLVQLNYRRGMGDKYYQGGIEALEDYFLEQASHHFYATGKYDAQNERAARRRSETDTKRADERVIKAEELEEGGQYSAARNEFRLATLFDPDHPVAKAGLERCKLEERAAEFMRECDRRIMRRQFDLAEKALDEGAALTVRQKEAFESERERLMDARLTVKYEAARAIEVDHRFEEAIVAFDELLAEAPQGFFRDAIARKDTLTELVKKAEEYYSRADAASTPTEQLTLFKQVLVVYPEYKDTRARAAALELELAPKVDSPGN